MSSCPWILGMSSSDSPAGHILSQKKDKKVSRFRRKGSMPRGPGCGRRRMEPTSGQYSGTSEEAEHYSHAPGSQGAREKPERLVGQPGLPRASCPRPCLARKRQVTPTLTLTPEVTTKCSLIRHTTRISFPDRVSMRGADGDLRPRTAQAAPPSLHTLQLCGLVSWISAEVKSRWA